MTSHSKWFVVTLICSSRFSRKMMPKIYCSLCKTKFTREYNLNVHNRTKHSKKIKKIRCPSWPTCKGIHKSDGLYSNISNLTVHYKKHHADKRLNKNNLKWIYVNKKSVQSEGEADESATEDDGQNENVVPSSDAKKMIFHFQ